MKNKRKFSPIRTLRLWFRALGVIHRFSGQVIPAVVTSSILTALRPFPTIWLSAQFINELAGERDMQRLMLWVALTLAAEAVMSFACAAAERWYNAVYSWDSAQYTQHAILTDKMLDMDFCSVEDPAMRENYSQIKQDNNWSGWGLLRAVRSLRSLLNALISIALSVGLCFPLFTSRIPESAGKLTVLDSPLFIVLLAAVLVFVTITSPAFAAKGDGCYLKISEEIKFGNRIFFYFGWIAQSEPMRGLDIRIYDQESIFRDYLFNRNPFRECYDRFRKPYAAFHVLSRAVSVLFTAVVYFYVGLKAWAGAFAVGSAVQYIGAITTLFGGFSGLFMTVGEIWNNAPYLENVFRHLDLPNSMYMGSLTTEKRSDRKYDIEFRNVSFKYPGTDSYVLKNISMKFRVGQRLAIVGQNGSGKTTFVKLLCRLYDPDEGEILLNGIDIRKYSYEDYMKLFSVVFQDFCLLSYKLGQNVAASEDYDRERVEDCLVKAGFGEKLRELPDGTETFLYKDFSQEGVEVSGGEAQKIAIARALYKDAPFIVLDEPTAALDPVTEAEIYEKFNEIVGDKTAVCISHRLSSCRFCDEILVFDDGRIVQQGSHDELVADESGEYFELWNAQAQYYTNS